MLPTDDDSCPSCPRLLNVNNDATFFRQPASVPKGLARCRWSEPEPLQHLFALVRVARYRRVAPQRPNDAASSKPDPRISGPLEYLKTRWRNSLSIKALLVLLSRACALYLRSHRSCTLTVFDLVGSAQVSEQVVTWLLLSSNSCQSPSQFPAPGGAGGRPERCGRWHGELGPGGWRRHDPDALERSDPRPPEGELHKGWATSMLVAQSSEGTHSCLHFFLKMFFFCHRFFRC